MIPFYGWGRINPKKWTKGSYTRKKLSFKLKLLSMFLNQAIVFWHCDRYCGSLIVYSMTICLLGKSKSEIRQAINQNRSTYTVFFCVCSMLSSTRAPVNPVNWVMVAGQTVMFDFCIITWNINKPLKRGKTCLKNILRNYFFFFCNPLFELYSSCNFRGQMLQITSDFCFGSIISFCNWYNWNVSG